jgi:hypothetical protein
MRLARSPACRFPLVAGAAALVLAALAACAGPDAGRVARDAWVGATEVELVAQWGPPSRRQGIGEATRLAWDSARTVHVPGVIGTTRSTSGGGVVLIPDQPAMDLTLRCTTAFLMKGGVAVSWTTEGDDCRYAPVARRPSPSALPAAS